MMSQASPPSWLADEDHESDKQPLRAVPNPAPVMRPITPAEPAAASTSPNSPLPISQTTFHFMLHIITMSLCVLMAFTAVIGLGMINSINESGRMFVGSYMLFFSTLLFIFELNQLRPVEMVEYLFRRNFGFLFGALGKALFIIFIAFLCFGLEEPATLTTSTGILLACFGALEVGLYLKYPDVFEQQQ